MDYERFKEGFQDALKAELAVRGADVEHTARRVDKMNDSYDAITVALEVLLSRAKAGWGTTRRAGGFIV